MHHAKFCATTFHPNWCHQLCGTVLLPFHLWHIGCLLFYLRIFSKVMVHGTMYTTFLAQTYKKVKTMGTNPPSLSPNLRKLTPLSFCKTILRCVLHWFLVGSPAGLTLSCPNHNLLIKASFFLPPILHLILLIPSFLLSLTNSPTTCTQVLLWGSTFRRTQRHIWIYDVFSNILLLQFPNPHKIR